MLLSEVTNFTGSLMVERDTDQVICAAFALCENYATRTIPNPILGDVPACERCAAKLS